jgi:chlorobactene glucosyltransferase
MYHSLGEAFDGFSKNLFAAFDYNLLLYVPIWIWLGVVFLEPPVVLILGFLEGPSSGSTLPLAAAAVGLSLLLWGVTCWKSAMPPYLALFYPVIMLATETIAAGSLMLTLTGRAVWKGRRLQHLQRKG